MISQYSNPSDIDREFWQDIPKARYWLKRHTSNRGQLVKVMDDGGWDVFDFKKKYSFSEPIYYNSPQTGNRWMTYIVSKNDTGFRMCYRTVLYYYTSQYMTIMIPVTTIDTDNDGNPTGERNGVTLYTAHMFQRMADPERLGVDMSDRVKVIRNFVEFIGVGWGDKRPPRDGEKHDQIILRTPASWLRGHTVNVGDRFVNIYRTFYTDRSMTYAQMKDVRTFKKFADANRSAIQSPDK